MPHVAPTARLHIEPRSIRYWAGTLPRRAVCFASSSAEIAGPGVAPATPSATGSASRGGDGEERRLLARADGGVHGRCARLGAPLPTPGLFPGLGRVPGAMPKPDTAATAGGGSGVAGGVACAPTHTPSRQRSWPPKHVGVFGRQAGQAAAWLSRRLCCRHRATSRLQNDHKPAGRKPNQLPMVGPLLKHPCAACGAPQVELGPRLARPVPWPQAAPADLRVGACGKQSKIIERRWLHRGGQATQRRQRHTAGPQQSSLRRQDNPARTDGPAGLRRSHPAHIGAFAVTRSATTRTHPTASAPGSQAVTGCEQLCLQLR